MSNNKRFTCHQMIETYTTNEDIDFDFLKELIEEQRQPRDLRMHISDGNKIITYKECVDLLNNLTEENKELKQENQRLNQTLEYIQKELNRYNNEWVDL